MHFYGEKIALYLRGKRKVTEFSHMGLPDKSAFSGNDFLLVARDSWS